MDDLELRAKTFAKWHHQGQFKKYSQGKIPYYLHPRAVAWIVKSVPHTKEQVAAAHMHDVLEDTPDDKAKVEAEMRFEFGDVITDYVIWLTDVAPPGSGNRAYRKAKEREHIFHAPPAVKTVKIADLLDNSSTILMADIGFARIYLPEKRLMLDQSLRDGDPTLWARADEVVKDAWIALGL